MKIQNLALGAILSGISIAPATAGPLPMDSPVTTGSVETVCTGVGSGKDDPRWASYPVKVEFSNGGAQYLSGAHVSLSQGGKSLASLDCAGSWVLFKLAPGSYKVDASLLNNQGGGVRSGVNGTPTFFINGHRHDAAFDFQSLVTAIEGSLGKSRGAAAAE